MGARHSTHTYNQPEPTETTTISRNGTPWERLCKQQTQATNAILDPLDPLHHDYDNPANTTHEQTTHTTKTHGQDEGGDNDDDERRRRRHTTPPLANYRQWNHTSNKPAKTTNASQRTHSEYIASQSVLPPPDPVLQATSVEHWTPRLLGASHHEEGQYSLLARAERFPGRTCRTL